MSIHLYTHLGTNHKEDTPYKNLKYGKVIFIKMFVASLTRMEKRRESQCSIVKDDYIMSY